VRSPRINKSQSHGLLQQHTPDAVKETGEEASAKVKVSTSSHTLGSKLASQQEEHAVSPAAKKSIFGVFGRSRKASEKENPSSQSPGPPGGTGEGANSDSKPSNDGASESAIQAPQAAPHETEGTDFPEHECTDDTEEDCDLQRRGSSASSAEGISTPGKETQ
jgi:cytoskeletal protein RodZ